MKKYFIISISVIIVGAIFTAGYFFIGNNKQDNSQHEISLPSSNIDSAALIPSTNISLPYASQGFYNLGARLTTSTLQGLVVSTQAQYDAEKGAEYVVLSGRLVRAVKSGETLKKFIESSNPPETDRDYSKNGKYEVVNGQEYFIYKATEDVTVWYGYTIAKGNFVLISLAYKSTDGVESQKAYKQNDELFTDIISRTTLTP